MVRSVNKKKEAASTIFEFYCRLQLKWFKKLIISKQSWIARDILQNWFTTFFSIRKTMNFKKLSKSSIHPTTLSDLVACIPIEVVLLLVNDISLVLRLIILVAHFSNSDGEDKESIVQLSKKKWHYWCHKQELTTVRERRYGGRYPRILNEQNLSLTNLST